MRTQILWPRVTPRFKLFGGSPRQTFLIPLLLNVLPIFYFLRVERTVLTILNNHQVKLVPFAGQKIWRGSGKRTFVCFELMNHHLVEDGKGALTVGRVKEVLSGPASRRGVSAREEEGIE